jgi:hypothetical protein
MWKGLQTWVTFISCSTSLYLIVYCALPFLAMSFWYGSCCDVPKTHVGLDYFVKCVLITACSTCSKLWTLCRAPWVISIPMFIQVGTVLDRCCSCKCSKKHQLLRNGNMRWGALSQDKGNFQLRKWEDQEQQEQEEEEGTKFPCLSTVFQTTYELFVQTLPKKRPGCPNMRVLTNSIDRFFYDLSKWSEGKVPNHFWLFYL